MIILPNQHVPEFRSYPKKKPRSKKRRIQRKYIKKQKNLGTREHLRSSL